MSGGHADSSPPTDEVMICRKNIVIACGALFLVLLPPVASMIGQPYLVTIFSRIVIYGLAAVSLDLLIGYGGLVSLGHAVFLGVGAYTVGICHFHSFEMEPFFTVPFQFMGSENGLVVLPLAMVVAGSTAMIIGLLSLRTSGMHFIMITLAFAQMGYYFFVSLAKYGGDDGLSLYARNSLLSLDLGNDIVFYYLCLGCLVFFVLFSQSLVLSRFGLVARGTSNNERRIRGLGINPNRFKLVLFIIGAIGAGLAGALLANQTEYVSPGVMHWTMSGELMVMVLLGGLGTLFGPILGAACFLLLEEFLAMYTEHWMVYMGPLLILVVIFSKKGLFGLLAGSEKDHE